MRQKTWNWLIIVVPILSAILTYFIVPRDVPTGWYLLGVVGAIIGLFLSFHFLIPLVFAIILMVTKRENWLTKRGSVWVLVGAILAFSPVLWIGYSIGVFSGEDPGPTYILYFLTLIIVIIGVIYIIRGLRKENEPVLQD